MDTVKPKWNIQIQLHADFHFEKYWKYQPSISNACHCVANNTDVLQSLEYS